MPEVSRTLYPILTWAGFGGGRASLSIEAYDYNNDEILNHGFSMKKSNLRRWLNHVIVKKF